MRENNQNESALWLQFKNGNKDAFAEIYRIHITSLIAYGTKLCADEDLLKDNIQDLFIELWNCRENLAEADCVKFYLFKALRYKLIRAEKRRQSQTIVSSDSSNAEGAYNRFEISVETKMIDKEMLDLQINTLRKAIAALSKRQQEVIQLKFYQGFSNEQIADLMQMNYQSVSNLVYTSLCRIKNNLKTPVFTTALVAAFSFLF